MLKGLKIGIVLLTFLAMSVADGRNDAITFRDYTISMNRYVNKTLEKIRYAIRVGNEKGYSASYLDTIANNIMIEAAEKIHNEDHTDNKREKALMFCHRLNAAYKKERYDTDVPHLDWYRLRRELERDGYVIVLIEDTWLRDRVAKDGFPFQDGTGPGAYTVNDTMYIAANEKKKFVGYPDLMRKAMHEKRHRDGKEIVYTDGSWRTEAAIEKKVSEAFSPSGEFANKKAHRLSLTGYSFFREQEKKNPSGFFK